MNKITTNEIVTLDNGKEFYCFQVLEHEGVEYVYLISTTTPIEIRLAKQRMVGDSLQADIIDDKEEKIFALKLFQKDYGSRKSSAQD